MFRPRLPDLDQSDSDPTHYPGSLERHKAPVIASSMGPSAASAPHSSRLASRWVGEERPQNWRTVSPSVIAGGSTVVLTFSFTHPAARREDSSVPVLSSQTVTAAPPLSVRKAA